MTRRVSFEASKTSDLAALEIGDCLHFSAVKFKYLSESPISRLRTPGHLQGVVLSIHVTTDDSHKIPGCAVMIAPGVALCATHVFRDDVGNLEAGRLRALCVGTAKHGNELWNLRHVTFVPNTELCILSLSLIDGISPDRTFHQASITTRWPRKGERLVLVAFKAEQEDCINWKPGDKVRTHTLACAGSVMQHFPGGRGRMLPGPCLEVDFESWAGMSGGPVFDEDGWLVGLLSVSLGTAEGNSPSFVSLAFSALAHPFRQGWMIPSPDEERSLLLMAEPECVIEGREMVRPTFSENGTVSGCTYTTWQDR